MSLLDWILLELIAGFMASNIVRSSGQGLLLDLVLGVMGAVVSGLHSDRRDRAHRLQSLQYGS